MRYLLLLAGIFTVDYQIKNRVEKTRNMHEPEPVLGNRAVLQRYHNYGAFLNLGEKKALLVHALSLGLTAAVFILFLGTLTMKGCGLLKTGLAFLLGGAFSNTYDRLKRKYVVDYFSLQSGIPALDRVVFNLGDFAILIGALCVVLGAEGKGKEDGSAE